jgi:ligand-binding sensor domain-containing protein
MKKLIYCLPLLLVFITSCNGQVKTDSLKKHVSPERISTENLPKMILTQGVTSGNITCELQERNGCLWFSTSGEGVYRFDGKSFTNFTTKDGLCDNYTSSIIQDKSGNILIGTNAGICKFDGKNFNNYFETDSLNKLRITTLLEDKDGNLWFGVMNKGIYRYDGTTLSNLLYKYEHSFYGDKYEKCISDIIQDKKGNIWFSSWNGGGVWRYDGKNFKSFLPSIDYYKTNQDKRNLKNLQNTSESFSFTFYSPLQDYITDDMIFSMTEDKAGNIWFATRRHGVCYYDGKSFTSFKENEGFISYGIYSIFEDKKGNMWFATDKNGVYCYDGEKIKNYTTADGLINNSVFSILEDKEGNLWFGTRSFGLSRFDGKTFTTFSEYKAE